ncbi:PIG-X, partial [Amylostereum chailletii]
SRVLSSKLDPARGFHTTSKTHLLLKLPRQSCSLYLAYTLSPHVFADPYELELHGHAFTLGGKERSRTDLEAPVFALNEDAKDVLLLNVHHALKEREGGKLEVEVPLHLRYGRPTDASEYASVDVAPPVAFWACEDGGFSVEITPELTHVARGVEGKALYIIEHAPEVGIETVRVPVGYLGDLRLVEGGTVCVVLVAFMWVVWKVVGAGR